jgi:transforming growth factor-beta-induced protein
MKTTLKSLAIFGIVAMSSVATAVSINAGSKKDAGKKIAAKQMDIVETAVAAGNFKTLVAAVQAAGLVETLKGEGPFTVFAPTDEAFAKLPAGTVEALLKDKAKLASILTYHVVAGKVMAADAIKLTEAKTVNGQSFKIVANKDGVMIDNAKVVKADIVASNGVIHVIDAVILPKEEASK